MKFSGPPCIYTQNMKKKIKKIFFGKKFFFDFSSMGYRCEKIENFRNLQVFYKTSFLGVKNAQKHESDVKKIR